MRRHAEPSPTYVGFSRWRRQGFHQHNSNLVKAMCVAANPALPVPPHSPSARMTEPRGPRLKGNLCLELSPPEAPPLCFNYLRRRTSADSVGDHALLGKRPPVVEDEYIRRHPRPPCLRHSCVRSLVFRVGHVLADAAFSGAGADRASFSDSGNLPSPPLASPKP